MGITDEKDFRMFMEREEQKARISFEREQALFHLIKSGDVEGVLLFLGGVGNGNVEAGTMSTNSLRQSQYVAVTLVAIGIRYAITGGLLETEAYSMSDYFIQRIDSQKTSESVVELIWEMMTALTVAVRRAKVNQNYSPYIRKAIDYIYKNLHNKITLTELSLYCGISKEYLSRLFKKDTGISISAHISKEKLETARTMLLTKNFTSAEIANTLGFCSQSHFIQAFKKQYGITPSQIFG